MQAVIEFRLAEAISGGDFDKLQARFAKLDWKAEQLVEFEMKVEIGVTGAAPLQRVVGYRFTSPDATRVIGINQQNYSLTALPPYPGWEGLLAEFNHHLPTWRKVVGRRALSRIGVRYINRFDIPCPIGSKIRMEDYMVFRSTEPDILDEPVRGLTVQVNSGIIADRLQVNLTTQTVDSPLVDHVSLSLDIDIFRDSVDVPQSDSDISDFLEVARRRRTEIFEKCITDEMRKVIS